MVELSETFDNGAVGRKFESGRPTGDRKSVFVNPAAYVYLFSNHGEITCRTDRNMIRLSDAVKQWPSKHHGHKTPIYKGQSCYAHIRLFVCFIRQVHLRYT